MGEIIWWIGVIHIAAYVALGTAAAVWAALVQIVKWNGNSRVIIVWYANRIRASKGLPPLKEPRP